jgi:hypothetical protein
MALSKKMNPIAAASENVQISAVKSLTNVSPDEKCESKKKKCASPGSWFTFILGAVVASAGAVVSVVSPTTGAIMISTGMGMMGAGITKSGDEALNGDKNPDKNEPIKPERK